MNILVLNLIDDNFLTPEFMSSGDKFLSLASALKFAKSELIEGSVVLLCASHCERLLRVEMIGLYVLPLKFEYYHCQNQALINQAHVSATIDY